MLAQLTGDLVGVFSLAWSPACVYLPIMLAGTVLAARETSAPPGKKVSRPPVGKPAGDVHYGWLCITSGRYTEPRYGVNSPYDPVPHTGTSSQFSSTDCSTSASIPAQTASSH